MGTEKRARQKELHQSRLEAARKQAESEARRKRVVTLTLVGLLGAAVIAAFVVFGGSDDKDTEAADSPDTSAVETTTTTTAPEPQDVGCAAADGSSEQVLAFTNAPEMCIDPAKSYSAAVTTNQGAFTIALDAQRAPKTVNNFVNLARYRFYDGLIFHRIIDGFMFQGGDPTGTGSGGPGYEFEDELPAEGEYEFYSVAMANSGPDTNGSQFFVITGQQGVGLPPSYSLFGKVVDGTDVADKIGKTETDDGDQPLENVVIESVTITEA